MPPPPPTTPPARPLVSVIMPVYNCAAHFAAALDSVERQDYPNIEVAIVDDGSSDGSAEIAASFCRSSRRTATLLAHPDGRNRGIAASYRLGFGHCRGEYIAFLEHDDLWPADKISTLVAVFEAEPQVGVVFAEIYTCDAAGRPGDRPVEPWWTRIPADRPFGAFWRLCYRNFVCSFSSFMTRRSLMRPEDLIDEPEGFQDWMLLLALSLRGRFFRCSRTRTLWRKRADSYHAQIQREADYMKKVRRTQLRGIKRAVLSRGIGR